MITHTTFPYFYSAFQIYIVQKYKGIRAIECTILLLKEL
jgi:hypothetical protein